MATYGSGLWGEPRRGIGAFYFDTPVTPLVAGFSGTPLSGYHGLVVSFTDESTGEPDSWLWDFGDGSTSTEQNPIHQYTTCGSFNVTLTISRTDI